MKMGKQSARRPATVRALVLALILGAVPAPAPSAALRNDFDTGLEALRKGRYAEAVAAFSTAIETVPGDYEAYNNRGYARIYTGDYAGAVADCTRALELSPRSAKAFNNRGYARMFQSDYNAAIADFTRALELNPRYLDAFSNRALALSRKGAHAEAIDDCTRALAINPRSAKALYNRGYARTSQGDPVGAMGDYLQVLEINPDFVEACNNLAWILATSPEDRLRDGGLAVRLAQRAVATHPNASFLDTLAAAYAEAGRFPDALAVQTHLIGRLAGSLEPEELAPYVARLAGYEEGRPHRDALTPASTAGLQDLQPKLAALGRRIPPAQPAAASLAAAESTAPGAPLQPAVLAADTGSATLTLAAAGATGLPVARPLQVATPADTPVTVILQAEPIGAEPLGFELESVPTQGSLSGTLPRLEYRPRPGFTGVDRFAFRVTDGQRTSEPAVVTIAVGVAAAPPAAEASPAAAGVSESSAAPAPATHASPAAPPAPAAPDAPAPAAPAAAEAPPAAVSDLSASAPPAAGDLPAAAPEIAPEPAPAPPAGHAAADLPAGARYTLQVRAVRGEDGAAGVVEKLRAEGFAAFAHPVDLAETGRWYRVFVGGYPTLEAAREALAGLDTARFPDAYIRKLPAGVAPGAAPPAPSTAAPTFPYGYQVSSTRQPAQALEVGQNLAARGFAAYLGTSRLPDGTLWHHVFVGAFATLEDARPLREQLAGAGYAEAFLIPVAYTLTLRPPDPAVGPADPAGRLQAMGHLVYRLPGDGDEVWRVGGYQERRDAEEALESLTAAGFAAEVTPR